MIEVSVTAVKGGFRELYKTPNLSQSVAREIRSDSGSGFSLGKEAFSMFTVVNGVVFSKCRIVTDGMGGQRIGNVNISLFIPSTQKLSGKNIVELLNKLLDTYCEEYVQDNNLGNIIEDWTFVTALTSQYENSLRTVSAGDGENSQQGTGEAAYVYYSSNEELQKYFDAPFQKEYAPYRQIFFVEQQYENAPENPLNALRHDANANLTGKIELENPKYKGEDIYYKSCSENHEYVAPQKEATESKVPNESDSGGRKRAEKSYYLKIDEKCGKKFPGYETQKPTYSYKSKCGYKFVEWHDHSTSSISIDNKTYDGYYEAVFKERWWHKKPIYVCILCFIVVIGVLSIIFYFFHKGNDTTQQPQKTDGIIVSRELYKGNDTTQQPQKTDELHKKITAYCDGIELNLDTLKQYKTQVADNETLIQRIDACIALRENLKLGKVTEIKNSNFKYSTAQNSLKTAIAAIKDNNKGTVGDNLNTKKNPLISEMDLNAIANFIQTTIANQPTRGGRSGTEGSSGSSTSTTTVSDITSEIIQYIKGSELDKQKLNEYKKECISESLKNSIQLCLDFWELDGGIYDSDKKTYWSFREKINKDSNFDGSKLKAFLDRTSDSDVSYSEQDKKKGLNE
jgi:hypothetical protein